MKHLPHLLVVIAILFGTKAIAQQTYFNVPNSQVTSEGDMFFQVNTFITDQVGRTQINGMYGLNKNTEIGINALNQTNETWLGITAMHRETLTAEHNLTVGGTYYVTDKNAFLLYGLITANKLLAKANINAGVYYGNEGMFGASTFGIMAGIDYPVINDKFRAKAEYMSGDHWMNGLNVGLQYTISKNMHAGLGLTLIKANTAPSPFILQLHYNL